MDHAAEPHALQIVQIPGLRVVLMPLTQAEAMFHPEAMPHPLPLDPNALHPLPSYLPAGLNPMHLGEGYCGVDRYGRFHITWIDLLLPAGATLSLPWDQQEGPPPAMQGFQFRGRDAIAMTASWSMVSTERLPLVITRAGPDRCWLVGGRVAIDDLARVAISLPVVE